MIKTTSVEYKAQKFWGFCIAIIMCAVLVYARIGSLWSILLISVLIYLAVLSSGVAALEKYEGKKDLFNLHLFQIIGAIVVAIMAGFIIHSCLLEFFSSFISLFWGIYWGIIAGMLIFITGVVTCLWKGSFKTLFSSQ